MSNLNYKLLKIGSKSKVIEGDQIYEIDYQDNYNLKWRNIRKDFIVDRVYKVRRPDKQSLEIIRCLQEEFALFNIKNKKNIWLKLVK